MFIYHHIKLYLLLFLAGCLEFNVYLVEQDVPGLQVYLQLYLLLVTSWQYVAVHSFYDILKGLLYLLLLRWVTCYQWYNFWPRDHSSSIAGKHFIWPIVCSPPPTSSFYQKQSPLSFWNPPTHTLWTLWWICQRLLLACHLCQLLCFYIAFVWAFVRMDMFNYKIWPWTGSLTRRARGKYM